MKKKTVTLDVRDDIKEGREPFGKIMQAVSRLKKNENFRLIAPFQPIPLFPILAGKGFSFAAKTMPHGDWEILFTLREEETAAGHDSPSQSAKEKCPCGCGRKLIDIDTRGLESPEPLVKILESLPQISDDTELKAHTDRRPIHLYAQLDERGYVGRTEEQKDGSFATYIHRCKN